MLSDTTRKTLIAKSKLIFVGLPVGKNSPSDSPIIGNKSLAQVVINRINSVTKNGEEFKYMLACIMQMIKETKGQTVEKIKLDQPSGLTDSRGFLIKKSK